MAYIDDLAFAVKSKEEALTKKTTKISTIEKITLTVEKKQKKLTVEKKALFFCIFFSTAATGFLFCFSSPASSFSTSTHNLFFQIKQSNHQKNNKYILFFLFSFLFCSISSTFTILIQPKNKQIKRETTRVNMWI